MRTKDNNRRTPSFIGIRYIFQLIDENGPTPAQSIYNKFIVYHLMTHIDGSAKYIQRAIHNVYRTIYSRTEAARICQTNRCCCGIFRNLNIHNDLKLELPRL